MRTIKINKNKPIYKEKEFSILEMKELENVLVITADGYLDVSVGDKIYFYCNVMSELYERLVTAKKTTVKVVEVMDKDENGNTRFKTEIPMRKVVLIKEAEKIGNEVKLTFYEPINIFAQDLYVCNNDIQIAITNTVQDATLTDLRVGEVASKNHMDRNGVTAESFLKKYEYKDGYGCSHEGEELCLPELYYRANRLITDVIYGTLTGDLNPSDMTNAFALVSQNEFYYKDTTGSCRLWDDMTSEVFVDGLFGLDYSGDGDRHKIEVKVDKGYWQVGVGLAVDEDNVHLDQEALLNDLFVNDIKSRIIPDVIDMERVKYIPTTTDGIEVSGLTFNLHFRTREEEHWSYQGDGWNGFGSYTDINAENLENALSDLLSDLNFVDTDAEYQKMKIKKSFIRLSFYNSDDPLTQSLLYYSTIFLDSGSIYGKFMKRRTELIKELTENEEELWDSDENPKYVLESCSAETKYRIDSQFNVSNEYNVNRCSEGFNLYLFADDAPAGNNEEKTIYMKVEFNHAGYGRTIPMIVWPIEGGEAGKLTIENYRKALYIPVKISHINNRYYYKFDVSDNPCYKESDDKMVIKFNLFEPKLID